MAQSVPTPPASPQATSTQTAPDLKAAQKSPVSLQISVADMRNAIEKSGYLVEYRVAQALGKTGYYVEANAPYPDPNTGISRELDISAITAHPFRKKTEEFLFAVILCECENNAQPVVLIENEGLPQSWSTDIWKVAGIPSVVRYKNGSPATLAEAMAVPKFHHYWSTPTGTQYCSFQQKKAAPNDWMALHPDDQHDAFTSLTNALEAATEDYYALYEPPRKNESEAVNLNVYYPLLVLQGDLFTAKPTTGGLRLTRRKHVCYLRSLWNKTRQTEYQIDIIQEAYIGRYLKLVDAEMMALAQRMRSRKTQVDGALQRITKSARVEGKKDAVRWREFLTSTAIIRDSPSPPKADD